MPPCRNARPPPPLLRQQVALSVSTAASAQRVYAAASCARSATKTPPFALAICRHAHRSARRSRAFLCAFTATNGHARTPAVFAGHVGATLPSALNSQHPHAARRARRSCRSCVATAMSTSALVRVLCAGNATRTKRSAACTGRSAHMAGGWTDGKICAPCGHLSRPCRPTRRPAARKRWT